MIDRTLAVGRIVVRRNDNRDHFISLDAVGRITELRGKQIKYECRSSTYSDEHVTPRLMLTTTVAVVCDTDDELTQIINFDQMAFSKLITLRESLDDAWAMATGGAK